MGRISSLVLFLVLVLVNYSHNERILCIFPTPAKSHQAVFRKFTNELLRRGHDLVIITPIPTKNYNENYNVTEIDVSEIKSQLDKKLQDNKVSFHVPNLKIENLKVFNYMQELTLTNVKVTKLIEDKTQNFDLIITESFAYAFMVLSKIYNAPLISISSYYVGNTYMHAFGAPYFHPILHPHYCRSKINDLTIWEKIIQIYIDFRTSYMFNQIAEDDVTLANDFFKLNPPTTLKNLTSLVELVFVNVNPIFDNNRPVPTNVVYLGGLHLEPIKELPLELKQYLDSSKRGVIYVSLGSNQIRAYLNQEVINEFLDSLETLPYDVLLKYDYDQLPRNMTNVRVATWLPQRDILHHPNVKAFVTQGGLQSADEAIDSETPLVGMPLIGDQPYNVEQFVKLGIGTKVDTINFKAEDLLKAVHKVTQDESYIRNIKKISNIFKDRPESSLDRAVWWTEYVIRHKGAKHYRPPEANLYWTEYFEIYVLLIVFSSITIILSLVVFICVMVIRSMLKIKSKQS